MDSGYAEVNGQKLYYEVHGDGVPLVMIQGFGLNVTSWPFQIPEFSKHFKVIAFDNRDAGRSSLAKGPYSLADMADDTAALMGRLGIRDAHILGASMGGMIAQEMALKYPEKVRSLSLVCTTARVKDTFDADIVRFWIWLRHNDPGFDYYPWEIIHATMTPDFTRDPEKVIAYVDHMKNAPYPMPPEAFERQGIAIMEFDCSGRVGKIKTPALVLTGKEDTITPPGSAKELAGAITGAELHLLPKGGHAFMFECPDEANRAILEFLRSAK